MLAGMVLISVAQFAGPFRAFFEGLPDNEALSQVADLGIFFLLLMAGVEMQLADTVRDARKSFAVAVGGVVLPLAAGIILGFAFLEDGPQRTAQAMLIGVALSITAIAASAKILQEFGLLKSEAGRVLITAALFDDIFGLFLLALLSSVIASGELPGALRICNNAGEGHRLLCRNGVCSAFTSIHTSASKYTADRQQKSSLVRW